MSKHKTVTFFILLLLVLLQALSASINLTDEERAYIASRAPVRSVSIDGSGPIQYRDSKGVIRGISVRVLEEIETKTGLSFDYMLYDKLGMIDPVFSDGTDILFGIPDQYARPGYTLSEPFLRSQTILFANKRVNSNDLANKRFAATYNSTLPQGISEEQAIYYYSREEALKAVNEGEADFGYGNAYSVAFYTLQHGFQDIYTVPQGKEERLYRILFIKDDPLLVSIINKALVSITPQEIQNIVLEATSQVERIITPALIIDMYGDEILLITLLIIAVLAIALAFIQKSRVTLDLEKKKFLTISEVSNEYLFEFDTHHETLVSYEKFKTLFTSAESLQKAHDVLISHLSAHPSAEINSAIELEMPSGKSGFFRISASKVPGQKREYETWIGKLQDISEEVERQNRLKNLAQTDGLTGLLNAMTTRHRIEYRLQHKKSFETDFCLLFDLDDFKAVNDTKGHLAGDNVLKTVGNILLQEYHSSNDIVGRVGGDEFCIYLAAIASEEAALSYCTTLLESVRFKLRAEGVTISIGGSKVDEKDTYETLYARVDRALYQAKGMGRNRIEIAEPQSEANEEGPVAHTTRLQS